MTIQLDTPTEVLAMIVAQATREGIAAAQAPTLTECAQADNTFREWANELRRERGAVVYRAAVNAYVDGKRSAVSGSTTYSDAQANASKRVLREARVLVEHAEACVIEAVRYGVGRSSAVAALDAALENYKRALASL